MVYYLVNMLVDQHRMEDGRCYCPVGFQINPANNRSCIGKNENFSLKNFDFIEILDVNECEIWDECDQDCQNTLDRKLKIFFLANNKFLINKSRYVCTCRANYTLEAGNRCKHINSKFSY